MSATITTPLFPSIWRLIYKNMFYTITITIKTESVIFLYSCFIKKYNVFGFIIQKVSLLIYSLIHSKTWCLKYLLLDTPNVENSIPENVLLHEKFRNHKSNIWLFYRLVKWFWPLANIAPQFPISPILFVFL